MDKIVIKISKNLVSFGISKKDIKVDLNNTNVIDTKELVFSLDYLDQNPELVSSFLNVIILKQNLHKAIIKDYILVEPVLTILNNISSITDLYIKPDEKITYSEFLKILDNHYLKVLNVFDIPATLLDRLDINKDLQVTIRNEILFISNFTEKNKIETSSDIFYKKKIVIDIFDTNDKKDFDTFINTNKYLKQIEFESINEDSFLFIMNYIENLNLKNIKVLFNQEKIEIKQIISIVSKYKKTKEKFLTNNNIVLKINYSDEYKKDNFLKQFNLDIMKFMLLGTIAVIVLLLSINIYRNYIDKKNYETIENDLMNLLTEEKPVEPIEPTTTEVVPEEDITTTTTTTTTTVYDIKYDQVFEKLLKINSHTVGWLTVKNTNINYPVVQYTDNDYYLNKDYYQNKNRHGWIFMDYKNDYSNLDKNTIIYGHNLANQKMFGTLRYALNKYWYTKSSNQIITFNTLDKNMKWQIFSIYSTPKTTDYLKTSFDSTGDFISFANILKERSIYNFNVDIKEDDNILTLSTCHQGHEQRLVIHAKLIKD